MLTGGPNTRPGPWRSGYVLPTRKRVTGKKKTARELQPGVVASKPQPKAVLLSETAPARNKRLIWPWLVGGGVLVIGLVALASKRRTRNNPGRPIGGGPSGYKDFHWGRKPDQIQPVAVSPRPKELIELGSLEAVTYSTHKGKDPLTDYVHAFGRKKPKLAYDPHAKALHIVGGGYRVEGRGIVG